MEPVTCCIRYKLAPGKQAEFEHYVRTWRRIIERLDGTYYGCFLPGERPPDASHFSFPEVGRDGPVDVATVVFSFDDLDGYERYRRDASNDPECAAVTAHYHETKCFISYERSFVRLMSAE
jgi:hypothetical protein